MTLSAWLLSALLCGSAFAEDGPAPAPGTVGRPISGRMVLVEAAQIEGSAKRQWQKLTRSLLDAQDDLYRVLDDEVRKFQATADGTSVQLVDGMRVEMQVIEREGDTVSMRVRVLDASGAPISGARSAYLTHGEGAEASATRQELVFAGQGEIVIEDLSTAEDAMVQIHLGDGDVLVVWIDEDVR